MASSTTALFRCLFLALCVLVSSPSSASGQQLSPLFYATTCPQMNNLVRATMIRAINTDRRNGASLLRLHFHDCFVQGCDGSILLDDKASFVGEKTAFPNRDSVRGYEVIDQIKAAVEAVCPGVVSCADILALAARDGTALLGGPSWPVQLGRRDSTTADWTQANTDLPAPTSDLSTLITKFYNKGLDAKDMTALSGAHTVGSAQCSSFRSRIYNDSNIDSGFATLRRSTCPATQGSNDTDLAPLDATTQDAFDNAFYGNLLNNTGLLHSDQELFNGGSQDGLVRQYSTDKALFFQDFATAMLKMGNIGVLTGDAGQIRTNCRVVNNS